MAYESMLLYGHACAGAMHGMQELRRGRSLAGSGTRL